MYTVTEIKNNKVTAIWTSLANIMTANKLVASLKITGTNSVFAIENGNGTVVRVVRR